MVRSISVGSGSIASQAIEPDPHCMTLIQGWIYSVKYDILVRQNRAYVRQENQNVK